MILLIICELVLINYHKGDYCHNIIKKLVKNLKQNTNIYYLINIKIINIIYNIICEKDQYK